MQTIRLTNEEFSNFLKCLSNLKEVCNDADIQQGILRQRTNNHTSIFEIDMRPLLSDASISLTNLKQKIELLKPFQIQDVEITIEEGDDETSGYYEFKDQYSSIKFDMPTYDFMDNRFMSEDELRNIFSESEDDLLLEHDFESVINERIKIVSQCFNIQTVMVDFGGEYASISARTPSKDQSAEFAENVVLNTQIDGHVTHITNVAFTIEQDGDISFQMFKDPDADVSLNKFSSKLGDMELNIYSRSQIIESHESGD